MSATVKNKTYLVASDDGSWHYAPVEAESPEEAIRKSEPEAGTPDQLGVTYHVYEVASGAHVFDTKIALIKV